VSPRRTTATVRRVVTQLRHDPRTIGLLVVVPCLLMALLRWIYEDRTQVLDGIAAPLLALFPFVTMFLVTSVTMLRERTSGTLERLLTMPIAKLDLLLGYGLAFGLFTLVQVGAVVALSLGPLGIEFAGSPWLVVLVALINALLGVALGLLGSAFARTEFQAVQFLPAIVFPQVLLSGLLVPRDDLPDVLATVSDLLPLSYAIDAMKAISASAEVTTDLLIDIGVTVGVVVAALVLAAGTLRRRSA
jgi:ABC-2 type transport system permease protein